MPLKVFLNLWHLLHCGGKSPLCGEREPAFTLRGEDQALTNGKKKSKYLWWILETGEYGGSASAISASSPRPALKEKTPRRRQTCSFTSGCVGRDPERNANGTPGSAAHTDLRSLDSRKDLNPSGGNKAARYPPAVSGAALRKMLKVWEHRGRSRIPNTCFQKLEPNASIRSLALSKAPRTG